MTDIIKKVSSWIPTTARSQTFTQADGSEGDVFLIKESLGHPASHLLVESFKDGLSIRFNIYQTVFPRRKQDGLYYGSSHLFDLASGVQVTELSGGVVTIASGERFDMNDIPISDIQIATASGEFSIFVN